MCRTGGRLNACLADYHTQEIRETRETVFPTLQTGSCAKSGKARRLGTDFGDRGPSERRVSLCCEVIVFESVLA